MKKLSLLLLLGAVAWSPAAEAVSIPYSFAGTVAGPLSPLLSISIAPGAGSVDLVEDVAQVLGVQGFTWTAIPGAGGGPVTVAVDRNLTVGGVTHGLDQDYQFSGTPCYGVGICKSGVFPEASTMSFDLGATGIVDVTFLRVVEPGGGPGLVIANSGTGTLEARFLLHDVVPEPSTALLLAAGLAGLAAAGRKRSHH